MRYKMHKYLILAFVILCFLLFAHSAKTVPIKEVDPGLDLIEEALEETNDYGLNTEVAAFEAAIDLNNSSRPWENVEPCFMIVSVPEPSIIILLGSLIISIGWFERRRHKR